MEVDHEEAIATLRREDSAGLLAEDCARDGGYEKGDYSISMGICICVCICISIGMASIVCISIKFEGISIIIHASKHRFNVSIVNAMYKTNLR